jgi:transposase
MNERAQAAFSLPSYAELEAANACLNAQVQSLSLQVKELTRQLDWFKRQLFGRKSEQRLLVDPSVQPLLNGLVAEPPEKPVLPATETVSYERRKKQRDAGCVTDEGLRFDASVPVEIIHLPAPAEAGAHEVIGEEVMHRLAQRPGSYVVLKYVRPVVKRREDGKLLTAPAPAALWAGSFADVSLVAGILIDKFCHHLPLYRQHQRLKHAGIELSRPVLTQWVHKAAQLLAPIAQAQLRHILQSKTLAMDETPIKAGREADKRRMRTGWYWPVYGEDEEIAFIFAPSRARVEVERILGEFTGTLLSDGAAAYASFARQRAGLVHAQCWAHARRMFVTAEEEEPARVAEALALIGALYAVEEALRSRGVDAEAKLAARRERALPAVEAFFAWVDAQCHRLDLLPSSRLAKALGYAREREGGLRVYLGDPTVAIDTNHLERALRTVPMGRKNWLFCWTEVGAGHVGVIQSLLTTCRLQNVNPYPWLVDVLQRVAIHPDKDIEALTPRVWKTRFADNPLRSDLHLTTL